LQRLPAHSFFVTPTWARILDEGGLGLRCTAVFGTDGSGEILLPIARAGGPLGVSGLRSMPWGTYGGPLAAGPAAGEAGTQTAREIRRILGLGWLVATPGPWPHVPVGRRLATYTTQIVDLGPGIEGLWKGLDKDARNQVRQAERAGVDVRADNSEEGFEEYFSMLEASAQRWGRKDPGKPRSLFDTIGRVASEEEARLWLARLAGRAVAGAVCFYGKSEVFYWSGAMHKGDARTRANNLIQWRVIEHAATHGFATYNMGASGDLEGVRRFKAGFGSQPREYPAYFLGTGPFRLAPAALRLVRAARRHERWF
jgi:GNAT acetyltransferase-like protein